MRIRDGPKGRENRIKIRAKSRMYRKVYPAFAKFKNEVILMAGKAMCGGNKLKIMWNGNKIRKGLWAGNVIYSSGNIVTYHVDDEVSYLEEVDSEDSCLSPKMFIPAKSGWEFVGWREDTAANGTVLSSKIMGDVPITLYAVFQQAVTVSYYNGSTTENRTSGYRYYNNGNITNPSFVLTQTAISGWTMRGWSIGRGGNSSIAYNNGAAFTRDSNVTLYGMYQQTVTLSYSGNGNTGGSTAAQTGTRYYNSNGVTMNPAFTLSANGFSRSGYTFTKWALNSADGTQYAPGASITLSANTTMYAVWTYVGNPFYIVQDSNCKQTLTWTATGNVNTTYCYASRFTAGSTGTPSVGADKIDSTQTGSVTAVSSTFSTNGNRTLRVKGTVSDAGGYIVVAGISKRIDWIKGGVRPSFDLTFDISAYSTLSIRIDAASWGYNGDPSVGFTEIYLY